MPIDATVTRTIHEMKQNIEAIAALLQQLEAERTATEVTARETAEALQPLAARLAVLSGAVAEPEPVPVEPEPEPKLESPAESISSATPVVEISTGAAA